MRTLFTVVSITLFAIVGLLAFGYFALGNGWFGNIEAAGRITAPALSNNGVAEKEQRYRSHIPTDWLATDGGQQKQILFGDLHVHSTFSYDAFMMSLPSVFGEGANPPANACDFARYCSALDFWAITDHAELLALEHWDDTIDTIRACNAKASQREEPDMVSFLGWEWSQTGLTPQTHYGHRTVILANTDPDNIPPRPIGAITVGAVTPPSTLQRALMTAFLRDQRVMDFSASVYKYNTTPICEANVPSARLPANCFERVRTPGELFAKLREWQLNAITIPHGSTWGIYSPPGVDWALHLNAQGYDPHYDRLMEVFSGHGNAERSFDFRAVVLDTVGNPTCPEETEDYLPACVQAGRIIEQRCLAQGLATIECTRRARVARQKYVSVSYGGHLTVPGVDQLTEWLDAGQCRDCFMPAFNYRAGGSAQYLLSLVNTNEDPDHQRFRMGFVGSSDIHNSRAGNGYKEFGLYTMTEIRNYQSLLGQLSQVPEEPLAYAVDVPEKVPVPLRREGQRQQMFFGTGGLAAIHAPRRDRESIWQALENKEVYGTSGPRILLWFDLVDDDGNTLAPMGSDLDYQETPRFRIRAAGSFEQTPGCPTSAHQALGQERLQQLCRGECYNPSQKRRAITRIEIIRIRPNPNSQNHPSEYIDDPWQVFDCPADGNGCEVYIEDPNYINQQQARVYYARAIEAPSLAVNGNNLDCQYNAEGECIKTSYCAAEWKKDQGDCLGEVEERAWSSPIFLDFTQ